MEINIVTKENYKVGRKVVRGPDWNWGAQDIGKVGILLESQSDFLFARVRWKNNSINSYSCKPGKYDLQYYEETLEQFFTIKIMNKEYTLKSLGI